MIFVLLWSVRALATIAMGGLAVLLLRRRSACLRNVVLRITLAVTLGLPLIGLYAPRVPVSLPAPAAAVPVAPPPTDTPSIPAPPPAWEVVQSSSPADPTIVHRAPYSTRSFSLSALIFPLYGLSVLVLVARWLAGWRKVRRIARAAAPMADEHGILLGAVTVPMTFGRTVLLPIDAPEWPETRRRAAILHERAHLRRGDWAWQTLAALFATIHWFNPAAWLLTRALRDTAEAAADDEVLAAGLAPSAYARELLAVANSAGPVGPALAMARRGGVKGRIAEVLSTHRDRRRPTRGLTAALVAVTALVGVGVAGLTTVKAAEPRESEAQSMVTFAGPVRLKDGRTLRLVALHDRLLKDDTWSPSGERIASPQVRRYFPDPPKNISGTELTPGKGQRRLQATLVLSGGTSDFQFTLDPPLKSSWSLMTGADLVANSGFALKAEFMVPRDAKTIDLRVGYASGKPHQRTLRYRLEKARSSLFEKGRNQPLIRVHLLEALPKDVDCRVVALDKRGHSMQGFASGTDNLPFIDYVGAQPPARVVLMTRPYQWVTFHGLACFPASAVKTVSSPTSPWPFRQASFQTSPSGNAQLAWIAEGNKVWRLDGSLDNAIRAPKVRSTTKPGWRRIAFGLRMPNGNSGAWWIKSTVWSKYAYPSDRLDTEPLYSSRPGERLAWSSVQLRPDVKRSNVGVDIFMPDWRNDVDTVPGDGPGQAKIVKGRATNDGVRPQQELFISFPGVSLPGRDRYAELWVYGKGKDPRTLYAQALPFGPDGSYTVLFPASEDVRRVLLRSCSVEHLRFDDVSLWPK